MRAMSLHLDPLVCRDGQFLNHTLLLQVCEGTLPVFLPPVTDNMLFLSQRKGKHLHQICFGREVDLGTTGIRT